MACRRKCAACAPRRRSSASAVPPLLGRTFTDTEGEIGNDQEGHPELRVVAAALRQAIKRPRATVAPRVEWHAVHDCRRDAASSDSSIEHTPGMPKHRLAFSSGFRWPLPEQKSDRARTRYGFFHVGRLRPGATVEQAQAQLDALHAATVKRFPQFSYDELGMYSAVTPLQEALTRPIRRSIYCGREPTSCC